MKFLIFIGVSFLIPGALQAATVVNARPTQGELTKAFKSSRKWMARRTPAVAVPHILEPFQEMCEFVINARKDTEGYRWYRPKLSASRAQYTEEQVSRQEGDLSAVLRYEWPRAEFITRSIFFDTAFGGTLADGSFRLAWYRPDNGRGGTSHVTRLSPTELLYVMQEFFPVKTESDVNIAGSIAITSRAQFITEKAASWPGGIRSGHILERDSVMNVSGSSIGLADCLAKGTTLDTHIYGSIILPDRTIPLNAADAKALHYIPNLVVIEREAVQTEASRAFGEF